MTITDSSSGARKGEVRFVVDAALLVQLGEELVNKRSVALGEVIKNATAYDADATSDTITFENEQTKGGTIEVADDGTSLSFERIRDAWMKIATSWKVQEHFSDRFRLPRTGAKCSGISPASAARIVPEGLASAKDPVARR
jgi:hypothetical protein